METWNTEKTKRKSSLDREAVQRGIVEQEWPENNLDNNGGNLFTVDPAPLIGVLTTMTSQIGLLRNEVLYVKKTASNMEDIRNQMKEFADHAQTELLAARKDMEEALEHAKEEMQKTIDDWKQQFDTNTMKAKQDLDYSRQAIADAMAEARKVAGSTALLEKGMQELKGKVEGVENHTDEVGRISEGCRSGLADLQQAFDGLQKSTAGLEKKVAVMSKLSDLEAKDPKLEQALKEATDLSGLQDLAKRVEEVESGLKDKTALLFRLQSSLAQMDTSGAGVQRAATFDSIDEHSGLYKRVDQLEKLCKDTSSKLSASEGSMEAALKRIQDKMIPLKPLPLDFADLKSKVMSLQSDVKAFGDRPSGGNVDLAALEAQMFQTRTVTPGSPNNPPMLDRSEQSKSQPSGSNEKPEKMVVEVPRAAPDQDEWLRGRLRPTLNVLDALMSDMKFHNSRITDLKDRLANVEKERAADSIKNIGLVSPEELKAGLEALDAKLGAAISQLRTKKDPNGLPTIHITTSRPGTADEVRVVDPERVDDLEHSLNEQMQNILDQVSKLFGQVSALEEKVGNTASAVDSALKNVKRASGVSGPKQDKNGLSNQSAEELFKQVFNLGVELSDLKNALKGLSSIDSLAAEVAEHKISISSFTAQTNFLSSQLDSVRKNDLKHISDELSRLQQTKANVADLSNINSETVNNKADKATVSNLEQMLMDFQVSIRNEMSVALTQLQELEDTVQKQMKKQRDNLKQKLINAVRIMQEQGYNPNPAGTDMGKVQYKCVVCDQPAPMKGLIAPVQAPGLFPSNRKVDSSRDPVVFRGGFRMPGRSTIPTPRDGAFEGLQGIRIHDDSPPMLPLPYNQHSQGAGNYSDPYLIEMSKTARDAYADEAESGHGETEGRAMSAPLEEKASKKPLPPTSLRGKVKISAKALANGSNGV